MNIEAKYRDIEKLRKSDLSRVSLSRIESDKYFRKHNLNSSISCLGAWVSEGILYMIVPEYKNGKKNFYVCRYSGVNEGKESLNIDDAPILLYDGPLLLSAQSPVMWDITYGKSNIELRLGENRKKENIFTALVFNFDKNMKTINHKQFDIHINQPADRYTFSCYKDIFPGKTFATITSVDQKSKAVAIALWDNEKLVMQENIAVAENETWVNCNPIYNKKDDIYLAAVLRTRIVADTPTFVMQMYRINDGLLKPVNDIEIKEEWYQRSFEGMADMFRMNILEHRFTESEHYNQVMMLASGRIFGKVKDDLPAGNHNYKFYPMVFSFDLGGRMTYQGSVDINIINPFLKHPHIHKKNGRYYILFPDIEENYKGGKMYIPEGKNLSVHSSSVYMNDATSSYMTFKDTDKGHIFQRTKLELPGVINAGISSWLFEDIGNGKRLVIFQNKKDYYYAVLNFGE